MRYSQPYHNAVELQRLLMDDARNGTIKPIMRAGIARAFVELEMLKLRLRMKPAPKPVDVSDKFKRKSTKLRDAAGFTEV